MGKHPINLLFRFILEIFALFTAGLWGWTLGDNSMKYVYAIGLPIAMATIWGVFAVPDDPSRSGKSVVVIPGWLRLVLELAFFGLAGWMLYELGYSTYSYLFLTLVLIHYLISYDRIAWLMQQ